MLHQQISCGGKIITCIQSSYEYDKRPHLLPRLGAGTCSRPLPKYINLTDKEKHLYRYSLDWLDTIDDSLKKERNNCAAAEEPRHLTALLWVPP